MRSAPLLELERELALLMAGLCQDAGIHLEVEGEEWSYDPLRKTLRVSERSLREQGRDWCAGRLANEVGHYWLTRHDLFPLSRAPEPPFPSERLGRNLMDILEDPRVDGWVTARYPGSQVWLSLLRPEPLCLPSEEEVPRVLLFCLECAYEAARDFAPSPWPVSPAVARALDATREARRAYASLSPSIELGQPGEPDPIGRYREELLPELLFGLRVPAPYEAEIQLVALRALKLARERILPEASELLLFDAERIARWLAAHPLELQHLQERLDEGQAAEIYRRVGPVADRSAPLPEAALEGALSLIEAFGQQRLSDDPCCSDRLCASKRALRVPAGPSEREAVGRPPEGERLELPPIPPTEYNRALAKVADQIDQLVAMLARVLRPRQRLRHRSGYPTGRRVDLRRLMAFEADPRRYNELWIRSTIPERRRVVFSLLIDLSGSMYGEKTEAALLGTILLAETLHRLQIPFAVDGFQDVVIPLAPFHEPFGPRVQSAIAGMVGEVSGGRPGGNNRPTYNDDGPCVLDAANTLLGQPAEERILIVVSDGQPEGCRSTEGDLRRTIAALTSPEVPLELLGVGLGPHTEHVSAYYPQSVASVPLARFADEIGGLICRGLRVQP